MSEASCSCAKFERLEGASVPAYTSAFLEDLGKSGQATLENHYRCRVCGREWEKRAPSDESGGKRPSLVRLTKK